MLSLAVKYRPKTFDDVTEQGAVRQILQSQLETKTTKNAYLFCGSAGTGKTTCARIFASEINDGKGSPIEIDAASNNSVDGVREIIDNAKFKALDAPYKVYILDECHMLSTGAWNAMLKLLEEPPTQTIFLMCTTDPQKIPATILSRVQRYDFQRITFTGIVKRLEYICKQENIKAEKEAIEMIAKIADGGMRDSISLLDKCISYSEDVTVESVVESLGTVDYDVMFNLVNALLDNDDLNALTIIETIYRAGVDLKQFIKNFSHFLLDMYKFFLLDGFDYVQIPSTFESTLDTYSDDDYLRVRELLSKIIELNNNIKWEMAPKPLIEACIVFICMED